MHQCAQREGWVGGKVASTPARRGVEFQRRRQPERALKKLGGDTRADYGNENRRHTTAKRRQGGIKRAAARNQAGGRKRAAGGALARSRLSVGRRGCVLCCAVLCVLYEHRERGGSCVRAEQSGEAGAKERQWGPCWATVLRLLGG